MIKAWTAIKIVAVFAGLVTFALLMGIGYAEFCRELSR